MSPAEHERWCDACLATAGAWRTGPMEATRVRPWATVLRAPTTVGTVWLKAGGPDTRFEAGLCALLADRVPALVLPPLGVDAARGWVLLPDGGPPGDAAALEAALPAYAELQRTLAADVDAMLDVGVVDMRPQALPARFAQALEQIPGAGELADLAPAVARWSAELTTAPGGASLDHNDLHPGNVLAGPRFYDWGDSVVAHPFTSLLLPLAFTAGGDAAAEARLRDAYLEAWTDRAPRAELERTLALACRVGKVARALTWQRAAGSDPGFASAPLQVLRALRQEAHLGAT